MVSTGVSRAAPPGAEAALAALEAMMCTVAAGALPHRSEATAYSQARAAVLAAPGGLPLPGFVHQCLTVFKFREFITLYDPDPAVRENFVRRAFARSREVQGDAARPAPEPQRWRF